MSAKVHISSNAYSDVQKEHFWPKYVKCKPWQTFVYIMAITPVRVALRNDRYKSLQRMRNSDLPFLLHLVLGILIT